MSWSHRVYACPFFTGDKKTHINCMCARGITLRSRDGLLHYADLYCSSAAGWRKCTLAREYMLELAEEEDDE